MYETHEQCAQLLAVEGVLLLCNVHFNLSGWNVIKQHSYQLEQEPGRRGQETHFKLKWEGKKTHGDKVVVAKNRDRVETSLNPYIRSILRPQTVNTLTNLAKVSSGWAFCASPLASWLPSASAVGGSFGEGLCWWRRRIVWQERRCGERESSWIRDRTMSSVDWETSTLSTARIPDTHSWTVATDAWRSRIFSSRQESIFCNHLTTSRQGLKAHQIGKSVQVFVHVQISGEMSHHGGRGGEHTLEQHVYRSERRGRHSLKQSVQHSQRLRRVQVHLWGHKIQIYLLMTNKMVFNQIIFVSVCQHLWSFCVIAWFEFPGDRGDYSNIHTPACIFLPAA